MIGTFTDQTMELSRKVANFVVDGTPSYKDALIRIKWGVEYCHVHCNESDSYSPVSFFNTVQNNMHLKSETIGHVVLLAVAWTLLRYLLTLIIFTPFAKWVKLSKINISKYPESIWKLMVYTITWSYTTYVIFGLEQYNHIYYEPNSIWDDFSPSAVVQPVVYWLYVIQLSFYVHSIYGTLAMDIWRKDSIMMLLHHVLTISLIGFSLLAKCHKIGVLVLWLHDITDVCLEFTKCNVYLKTRNTSYHRFNDLLSSIGFVCFAISWFVFRLFWYPLKVLYSTGYGAMVNYQKHPTPPMYYFFFNSMLWLLQILNVYWFMFIIAMFVRIITGQMDEIDDLREDESIREAKNGNYAKRRNNKKYK